MVESVRRDRLTFWEVLCDKGKTGGMMGTRRVNERMAALGHSEIRAMTQACVEVKGLNMAQGVCDTPAPAVVLKAAAQAIEQGKNVYSRFDGLPELRQAIAAKLSRDNGIKADPETEFS